MKQHALNQLSKMKRELKGWLKYRKINDEIIGGKRASKVSSQYLLKMRDWDREQRIATRLHLLLSEVFDGQKLPNPDVKADPNAAVKLATIAINGKLPAETSSPQEQGLIWFFWPIAALATIATITILTKISSDAETARERERLECIKAGACTDYGFWIKWASILFMGAWVYKNRQWLLGGGKRTVKKVQRRLKA